MTSYNRLDDSLRWRVVGWLEAGHSEAERTAAPQLARDFAALSRKRASRNWTLHPAPSLARPLDCIQQKRADIAELKTPKEWGHVIFSDESKSTRQSILVKSSSGGKTELAFVPPMSQIGWQRDPCA
ncbi:hypothetical protein TNCV_2207261 [Trichonephila clavipes]|uniref:Uncharacterized protein n=1 Tax=Trichonephila clavipes TaxID=2585209 RepID=A0A8X6S603_TRICX|nr:hypothetical protein TNCV_2207261 [Trichonephila clavipes]